MCTYVSSFQSHEAFDVYAGGVLDSLVTQGSTDIKVGFLTETETFEGGLAHLSLCQNAAQSLSVFGEGHDRGCGPGALRVFDDLWILSLHDRHTRVGGAQVYSNYSPLHLRTGHRTGMLYSRAYREYNIYMHREGVK